mmetsp:Transcript_97076/g.274977  ORF Transcript_97076/g.274977 Transcript_97076/m.274977 type:complete len:393 (-) Transcript_97076:415-1593(-)
MASLLSCDEPRRPGAELLALSFGENGFGDAGVDSTVEAVGDMKSAPKRPKSKRGKSRRGRVTAFFGRARAFDDFVETVVAVLDIGSAGPRMLEAVLAMSSSSSLTARRRCSQRLRSRSAVISWTDLLSCLSSDTNSLYFLRLAFWSETRAPCTPPLATHEALHSSVPLCTSAWLAAQWMRRWSHCFEKEIVEASFICATRLTRASSSCTVRSLMVFFRLSSASSCSWICTLRVSTCSARFVGAAAFASWRPVVQAAWLSLKHHLRRICKSDCSSWCRLARSVCLSATSTCFLTVWRASSCMPASFWQFSLRWFTATDCVLRATPSDLSQLPAGMSWKCCARWLTAWSASSRRSRSASLANWAAPVSSRGSYRDVGGRRSGSVGSASSSGGAS